MAAGVNTLIDSLNFFVQSRDITVLTVTATATSTQTGSDQVNTLHKGAIFNVAFTTISATCTVRIAIQGRDDVAGVYYTIASLSLDGITTGNLTSLSSTNPIYVYPGIATTQYSGQGVNTVLPQKFRAIASIGGATTSLAAVSFNLNASKIV